MMALPTGLPRGKMRSASLSDLLAGGGAPTQTFVVDAGRFTTLIGEKGTRIMIPAFAWLLPDGQVAAGEIRVTVAELTKKTEIIAAGLATTAEDQLLAAASMLQVQGFKGEIPLAPAIPIDIYWPMSNNNFNPLALRLYKAGQATVQPFGAHALPNLHKVSGRSLPLELILRQKYLHTQIDSCGQWALCTALPNKHPRMVSVKYFSILEDLQEKMAFLVFRDSNAVMRMYEGPHHFTSFNVPSKLIATAVVIGTQRARLLLGIAPIDQNKGFSRVYLEETGVQRLTDLFRQLNLATLR